MRVGADDDSMSARDKMLGRFCIIYAIVYFELVKKIEKRERKYFVEQFGRSLTANFFTKIFLA